MITAAMKDAPVAAMRLAPAPRGYAHGPMAVVAVTLAAALALGAGFWFRRSAARSQLALRAAWSENRALKERQETLRAELFEVARRLEALQSGRRFAPGGEERRPVAEAGRGST